MTIYAVGLIYNDDYESEVTCILSLWSTYDKAKEEAFKTLLRQVSATVVQSFVVDSPNSISEPEIIKSHTSFVRYGC